MVKKAPRRTAERILEVTLDLFNRFGEPNVSTTLISAELRISPGNLYYHYPAKDEIINALFDHYEHALTELLGASHSVRHVEDAGKTMQEIVGSVQRVGDIIGEITAAASEQSASIGQVNQSVGEIDRMTQQNAALVEESAAAAESLREQAARLSKVVQQFRLADEGNGMASLSRMPATAPDRALIGRATPQLAG